MNKKAVIILSGGLDSTTLLHYMKKQLHIKTIYAITFYYGQKHSKEIECAKYQAKEVSCKSHKIIDLSILGELTQGASALTTNNIEIPTILEVAGDPQPITYVPNRNLILLSLAASYAESVGVSEVYYGAQLHDTYSGYWDASFEFLIKVNEVLQLNRKNKIVVKAPFIKLKKWDLIKIGTKLKVKYEHTWTCYKGEDKACGVCPTCVQKGSKVLMANRTYKKIEEIKKGDTILTFNEKTLKFEESKVTNVINQGVKYVTPIEIKGKLLNITKDHPIFIKSQKEKAKFRKIENLRLNSTNKNYIVYHFNEKYLIQNLKKYNLGYLRGLIDGDGSYRLHSIFLGQKDKQIVDEFVILYDKLISPTKSKCKRDGNRNMYVFEGGYTPKFLSKTKKINNKDYYLGYLAGIIISGGGIYFNKSNSSINCVITQINTHKEIIENIKTALHFLNIKYYTYEKKIRSNEGFNNTKKDKIFKIFQFPKVWRIPIVYGGSKKTKILKVLNRYSAYSILDEINVYIKPEKYLREVYDLTSESGTFICEGILIHNCSDRIKSFKKAGIKDPLKYKIKIKW